MKEDMRNVLVVFDAEGDVNVVRTEATDEQIALFLCKDIVYQVIELKEIYTDFGEVESEAQALKLNTVRDSVDVINMRAIAYADPQWILDRPNEDV
jgi:hypothetical protein